MKKVKREAATLRRPVKSRLKKGRYGLKRTVFQAENALEHFNFEMRGNSRFISPIGAVPISQRAIFIAVDKDILLHLKVELL